MGILSGRDLFSPKYVTAIISDSSKRAYFIPIEYTIGDYFVATLLNGLYVFKIRGEDIKEYRGTFSRTLRIICYDTTHYLPLSDKTDALDQVIQKNSLPKVNSIMASVFKHLGSREKKDFKSHKLKDLIKEINEANPDQAHQTAKENIVNYLKDLNIDEIVTPLKKVSNFIQEDLITTDPKIMGTILEAVERVDFEHKKITNTPRNASRAWTKVLVISVILSFIGIIGFLMWDMGVLDGLTSAIPSFESNGNFGSDNGIDKTLQELYPTGKELKAAVDSGEVDYDSLSPTAKKVLENTP